LSGCARNTAGQLVCPRGGIECWGYGKVGVLLSECVLLACIQKWKAKQDRKTTKTDNPPQQQGQQHLNVNDDDGCINAEDSDDDGSFDIAEFQGYQFHQGSKGNVSKDYILLDNQSAHDTFYNPELLCNIKKAAGSVIVRANGGQIKYDHTGVLPGYGTVWYNPNGIANILSLGRVEDKGHLVEYSKGQFTVTNKRSKNVTIFQKQGGFFVHRVNITGGTAFVQTVEENLTIYTPRQILKARAARELYAMIGRPSLADFIGIVKHNLLPNVKVTAHDVLNAELIYGKDLGSIQGETTQSQPEAVIPNYVNIPPDLFMVHHQVTLCIDILYVIKITFLLSISSNIQFTTTARLPDRCAAMLTTTLIRKICKLYERRGFIIAMCFMDNEFEALRDGLLLHGIALNTCAPREHVPEIERPIRTVKERIRGVVLTLPFQKLPTIMIVQIAVFCLMWLNFFPPQGGVSPTLSPQTIITGICGDHDKHCRIPFGGYTQIHADPTPTNNAMESRTVGGISHGPTGNVQGSLPLSQPPYRTPD
jgi:hypothetical protein